MHNVSQAEISPKNHGLCGHRQGNCGTLPEISDKMVTACALICTRTIRNGNFQVKVYIIGITRLSFEFRSLSKRTLILRWKLLSSRAQVFTDRNWFWFPKYSNCINSLKEKDIQLALNEYPRLLIQRLFSSINFNSCIWFRILYYLRVFRSELSFVLKMELSIYIHLIFLCVVNIILTLAGIVLNTLVIASIWKPSQVRKKLCQFMIMVLSCFDLVAVVTNHPAILLYLISWLREDYDLLTKMETYVGSLEAFLGFSMFAAALLVMNIERYLGAYYPIFHRTSVTRRRLLTFPCYISCHNSCHRYNF